MKVLVDERQGARRLAFVHEEIPVEPGTLALAYPKWIPGEHGPTGPIQNVAEIHVTSGEQTLVWRRDPDDIFTFRVEVPRGVHQVSIDFDVLLENTISDEQILLAWSNVLLYPLGVDKRELTIAPSVLLPNGWTQASGLEAVGEKDGRTDFAPTSLERLIDSPVLAGRYLRTVPLQSSWPAELDITGDTKQAVDNADEAHAFGMFSRLIDQDRAMFGFRHWDKMRILVSQSEAVPFDGLEHEATPYNAVGDAGLSKKDQLEKFGWTLLAHEQSHSWCGKYRRPAGLYSKPDYQGPERTSLLWVYEGLNQYIGMLLSTRAGFNDNSFMEDAFAMLAARASAEPARRFVPLVDTASEDWVLRTPPPAWSSLRRGQDYYFEGALIWLRVDTIIREQSHGAHSLDDFLRSFFGQRDTGPVVVPYTREDVERALQALCPYDWHAFFESRIYQANSAPVTQGLEAAGWRLTFSAAPNKDSFRNPRIGTQAWFSIGLVTSKDGSIYDLLPGSPADKAGLSPEMTLIAVNGRAYSPETLEDAIAHPKSGEIAFIVRNFGRVESYNLKYAGGLRYPHLEPIAGKPDLLSEILKAK